MLTSKIICFLKCTLACRRQFMYTYTNILL